MNLKTRIQHVNSLPEEIRQRAISRMQEQLIFIDWQEEFLSLELCLKSSFVFKETFEGGWFWELVYRYPEYSHKFIDLRIKPIGFTAAKIP